MSAPATLTAKKVALARSYNQTDAGQAEYVADHFDLHNFVYDCLRERWMHWLDADARWLAGEAAVDSFWPILIAAARQRYREAPTHSSDTKMQMAEAGFALRAEKVELIEKTTKQLSKLPRVRYSGDWDERPDLIGTPGGNVIEIRPAGPILRDSKPEDRVTRRTGVPADPSMPTPNIDQFLLEIMGGDPLLVEALVRALGYSLTGSLKYQHFWLLYGTGSNGKSLLLKLILTVAGDYGYNTPFSTFEKQRNPGTQTNDAAHLYGRRFVMAAETGSSTTLSEERLKAWSGGDPVTCRFLYQRGQFTYDSQMHIWLAVNHKPTVVDDSHGFWRRAIVVPFGATFGPTGAKPADPDLLAKLIPELPGFLWKVCAAAGDAMAKGLQTPNAWLLATLEYKDENDDFGAFLDEECDTSDPTAQAAPADLFSAYEDWCEAQRIRRNDRLKQRSFWLKLKERGYSSRKSNGKRIVDGIRARTRDPIGAVSALY
jgi:putative DNA primase/helicase